MVARGIKRLALLATFLLPALSSLGPVQAADLTVTVGPEVGPTGTTVTLSGTGAPAGASMTVLWSPWFQGEQCGPQGRDAQLVAAVSADDQGRFMAIHRAEQQ